MRALPVRLTLLAAILAVPASARAETPQETLVRDFLSAVAFGAPVSIGGSSFDPTGSAVVLEQVSIGGPETPIRIRFEAMTVTDPRRTAGGAFAAHAIRGEQMRVDIHIDPALYFPEMAKAAAEEEAPAAQPEGGATVTTTVSKPFDVTYEAEIMLTERVVMPMAAPVLAADASVIDTALSYARASLAARADWFELDNVTVTTRGLDEADTTAAYDLIYMTGVHDGRIERSGYTNYRQEGRAEGMKQSVSVETGYATGIDGKAALAAIDPEAFTGPGPGPWMTVIQQQGVQNVAFTAGEVTGTVAAVEINALQMRQTETPLVTLLAPILSNPQAFENNPEPIIAKFVPNLFGLYRLNSLAIDSIEMTGPGGVTGTLGEIDVTDVDHNGIGAITFRRGALTIDETTSGTISLVTLNNIRFGAWKPLADLMLFGTRNPEADPPPAMLKDLILQGNPSTDFLEINGVAVKTASGDVVLDVLTATAGDYLGTLARRGDLAFTKLSIPVGLVSDPQVRQPLEEMGYEEIQVSGGVSWSWDTEKGVARLDDATFTTLDMGLLSLDAEVSGVPLSLLDDLSMLESRLQDIALVGAGLRFGNQGIVERTFEAQAKKLNQDPARFRDDFANALPLMLGFLESKEIQARFQDVLKAFFKEPQSLVVAVRPTAPLPFTAMEALGQDGAEPLLNALNLSIEANR